MTKPALFAEPLRGIVPPMVTPLRARDALDIRGLERLVEHLIAGGVSGLFLLGTTGEGVHLSYRLRRELVQRVCRLAAGRVPVMVGVTDTAFVEAVKLGCHAADAGADAVVVAPPYYLPLGQPELLDYLDHFLAEQPLPLLLYNFPALTKVRINLKTARQLMANPRVVGIKDSSGDMTYFRHLVRMAKERPSWTVMIGPEEKLAEAVLAGGHGGVNGGANIFPRLYVELCKAAQNGDRARARHLQNQVLRVCQSLYRVGRYSAGFIQGIKCALSCLGICDDFMSEPWQRLSKADRKQIEKALDELKDLTNIPAPQPQR